MKLENTFVNSTYLPIIDLSLPFFLPDFYFFGDEISIVIVTVKPSSVGILSYMYLVT